MQERVSSNGIHLSMGKSGENGALPYKNSLKAKKNVRIELDG
jgi:hypothetical protein